MTGFSNLRIAAIRLACLDVPAMMAFYIDAFGCRPVCGLASTDADATLTLGSQHIQFTTAPGHGKVSAAPSNSTAFQHFAIVVPDIWKAMARLHAVSGWTAISTNGPETLPDASGGVTAFKFRDPEGHPLELLVFPEGHRPDPWGDLIAGEEDKERTALGIDHSAITVTDTDAAIVFYAALGFTVMARQVNRGPEQGRLDALGNPVVEVTGLLPPGGAPPHLELLCYRKPGVETASKAEDDTLATVLVMAYNGQGHTGIRHDPDGHRFEIVGP